MVRFGIPQNKWLRALFVGCLAAGLSLVLHLSEVLEPAERGTYDLRARALTAPREGEEEVVLILVDEASLEWALETQRQSWPWPRQYYAFIANFARRANAASLTFDVMYSDDSFFGVSDDRMFADAIERQGNTTLATFYGRETGNVEAIPEFLSRSQVGVDSSVPDSSNVPVFERASFPVPELAQAAARLGNVHLTPDRDGVYRRAPLVSIFDGETVPSLSLATYLAATADGDHTARDDHTANGDHTADGVATPDAGEAAAADDGSRNRPAGARVRLSEDRRSLYVDGRRVPLDDEGNLIVRFDAPRRTRTRYAASGIIQSEDRLARDAEQAPVIDPSELEGKHVMVGLSAVGLFDLRPTPVDGDAPGVEFHAAMFENLMSGRFMQQVHPTIELLYVVLIALLAGFIATTLVRGGAGTALALIAAPVIPAGIGVLGYVAGLWLPVAVPSSAGLAGSALASVVNYSREGRERRFIKGAFSQYLSPAVIDRLLEDPGKLRLGGERRELSIFFSDLEGFTSLSEGLTPDELTQLLNEYLTEMTDIITGAGGTIDKYEGDAIIAFWNAPLDVADHPRVAVEAALRCQQKLAELRPVFRGRVGKDLFMRVGLNTGEAVVGNLGSRSRFDYTMLGDAVNLAARLEGNNKQFGTYTMISEATASRLPEHIHCRELGRIAVVGRSEPVRVFEPLTEEQYRSAKVRLEAFAVGLALYYDGKFEQAFAQFSAIDDDPPAQKYADRCKELAAHPPATWDGVWVMESK